MSRSAWMHASGLRVAALVAGLVLAACVWAAPASAATTCPLAGTWTQTTEEVGSTDWSITSSGTATEVRGGDAEGKATLSGGKLTITWTAPSGYAGVYSWTLDATCKSVDGSLMFTKVGPGDNRGGRPLKSSVVGPAPVQVKPPSACLTFAGARIAAAGEECLTRSVKVPASSDSVALSSPRPFAAKDAKVAVTVRSSAGNLGDTTIVGEGERTRAKNAGEAIAACWLIGPDAITTIDPARLKPALEDEFLKRKWAEAESDPELTLAWCRELVTNLFITSGDSRAAGAGCNERRIAIRGRMRKGKVVSLVPVKTNPGTAARYTCKAAPGGAIKLTVDGRRAGGLKKQLGKRLDLAVVRSPKAPADQSRLTFGFGAP